MNRLTRWIVLLAAIANGNAVLFAADLVASPPTAVAVRRSGDWWIADTANFSCRMSGSSAAASELASNCERLRTHLLALWGTAGADSHWVPRCEVVVHPTQVAYNQCLGRPNDASVGSTRLNFDQGRVTVRRINLRADAKDWIDGALPHELTHVVIAEQFQGRPLPRWADEGIAMLSESRAKHRLRLHDLRLTLRDRPTYRIHELTALGSMPPSHLRDAFYGQSLALTSRLIERSSPAEFLAFLQQSEQMGLDQALRNTFQLDGHRGLQSEWDRWVQHPDKVSVIDLRFPDILLASDTESSPAPPSGIATADTQRH